MLKISANICRSLFVHRSWPRHVTGRGSWLVLYSQVLDATLHDVVSCTVNLAQLQDSLEELGNPSYCFESRSIIQHPVDTQTHSTLAENHYQRCGGSTFA